MNNKILETAIEFTFNLTELRELIKLCPNNTELNLYMKYQGGHPAIFLTKTDLITNETTIIKEGEEN